jgi:hypothetical protein
MMMMTSAAGNGENTNTTRSRNDADFRYMGTKIDN